MKNQIWQCIVCLVVLFGCQSSTGDKKHTVEKPNIVFIFADDMTYEAIGALGNEIIRTPNLDRLVRGGTTFTHAYNMGGWNGAICVASRSMIISGRYLWRAKEMAGKWQDKDSIALDQTWGKLMEGAGYDTYMTGKWHVKASADYVFQTAKHIRPGMPADAWGKGGGGRKVAEAIRNGGDVAAAMPVGYNRPLSADDDSWDPTDTSFGGFWEGGKHWSEVVKDDALEFVKTSSQKPNPFFMYVAFNAPHDPRQSPQEYQDLYNVDDIDVPDNYLPEYPYKDDIGVGPGLRDEALAPFPRTEYAVQKHRQEYYSIISHLDTQIGEILDALEEAGETDNTYIFFTADHGLSVGHHGLIGKQNMYDHSMRVPLMVVGPDIPASERREQEVYLQDIMATSLELAGISKPEYVEFKSFRDIIIDPEKEGHYKSIYGAYIDLQRMVKRGDYKLIFYPGIDKVRLYNVAVDPNEMIDLAEKEEYQEKVKELLTELKELQKGMGDELEITVDR
ncbi:sulfatase-like hydrolase/transferase [Membranihabitans maritimus]|uniref:sulfatase-like hydrolase/transferase n=1 Tax=Membranihabitans maritimus TaxID=2904244 RepID=UPI001F0001B6|nr:sulfatase-like hydrolase/transferase [Membranihabitans maritimus]